MGSWDGGQDAVGDASLSRIVGNVPGNVCDVMLFLKHCECRITTRPS